jgi:hypothetical protein
VAESLAVSTANVTSAVGGTGATATSEADKAETNTAPATKEEGWRPLHDRPAADVGPAGSQGRRCARGG